MLNFAQLRNPQQFSFFLRQNTNYPVKPSEEGVLNLESVSIKMESTDKEDRKSMMISWALQVICNYIAL